MKHKVSELEGALLDAAVAKAEAEGLAYFELVPYRVDAGNDTHVDPTALIATKRCFVRAKFGEEVEL